MTDQLSPLAVQNASLLRALKNGPHASPGALAEDAGIIPNHVHRKLDALEGEGLIVRDPNGPKHVATLTQAAGAALAILALRMIPADQVIRWADNPRSQQTLDDAELQDLARSIGDKGVLQPIIVRPLGAAFEVIAGDRRRRASQIAVANGWQTPDFLIPAQVRDLTDEEAHEIAGIENIQRDNMHWMDEARWFLRLSTRPHNPLSASAIERLVGGDRKKRSIQDYTKCARELSPEDIARTYLPAEHKDHLSYVRARDLVGDKKEKPALELTPKLKLTLLELVYAAWEWVPPKLGEMAEAVLFKPPVGGPLGTLSSDRKLIEFGFSQRLDGRPTVARIKVTPELARYLEQIGWLDQPARVLYEARAAVIGDLQANALAQDAEFVTPELNRPRAATPSPQTETPNAPGMPPGFDADDDDGEDDDPERPPTIHHVADDEQLYAQAVDIVRRAGDPSTSYVQRRLQLGYNKTAGLMERMEREGVISPPNVRGEREILKPEGDGPTPNPPPILIDPAPQASPSAPEPKPLAAMLQIVVVEVAHKIATLGVERGPGTWAAPVLGGYYKDVRAMNLVQQHKMIAFMPRGHETLIALTRTALDWLGDTFSVASTGGRTAMSADRLETLQRQLIGAPIPAGSIYYTPWLNPPTDAAEPQAEVCDALPELATPPLSQPRRDAFTQQILDVTAEQRAIGRVVGALRTAQATLRAARARKLSADEIGQLDALIENALDGVKPFLTEDTTHV